MVFVYKKLAQFALRGALPPRRSESPVCAAVNKPSCALHLLGWFIGSLRFLLLGTKAEFWVLQFHSICPLFFSPINHIVPQIPNKLAFFFFIHVFLLVFQ